MFYKLVRTVQTQLLFIIITFHLLCLYSSEGEIWILWNWTRNTYPLYRVRMLAIWICKWLKRSATLFWLVSAVGPFGHLWQFREPRNSFKKVSAAQIGIFENVLSCTWVLDVDGSEKLWVVLCCTRFKPME